MDGHVAAGCTDEIGQLLFDPVNGITGLGAGAGGKLGGEGSGRIRVRTCEEAVAVHGVDHHIGAGLSPFRVVRGCQAGGRLDETGQHGGFRHGQVCGWLVEEALGRSLEAIGTGTEIDAVEIKRQQLVLVVLALQPQGEHGFLHLALQGALRREEQVLGQLLGDGGATLHHVHGLEIGHHGTGNAEGVDANMVIEPAVFDRDEGVGNIGRQGVDIDRTGKARAAPGQDGAVMRQDRDRRRAGGHGEVARVRKLKRP